MNQFKTPVEAFLYWEKNTPNTPFLKQFLDGKIKTYTYKSAGQEIRKFASALNGYNLSEKSHIALLSKNCAHWVMADLAIMMAGHVSIPIYPTVNAQSINQIIEHSEAKVIIIGKIDNFGAKKAGIPNIHKISINLYNQNEGDSWESLIKKHKPITKDYNQKKDDLITICYTSGTTRNPKGAMHTAGNFIQAATLFYNGLTQSLESELPKNLKLFSYLPLAHIAERIGVEMNALVIGAQISFPESFDTFSKDLIATQPHIFFAVPRLWVKFQERVFKKISEKNLDSLLKAPVINNVIINKIKYKLGLKNALLILSGAAILDPSYIRWYEKFDIRVLQGYGTTEDCIVSHFNLYGANKIGTVGKPLPQVKTKLARDGEVYIKNDCLTKGYFKEPELTKKAFDSKGFFKTGDIGEYDDDGYLTIIGRKKDKFKTDKGKHVSPEFIELQMGNNINIEQNCIVGHGLPQPIVLITLSTIGKTKTQKQVADSMTKTLYLVNHSLENHERIQKLIVLRDKWTVDNGFMTPTLKLKRHTLEKIQQPFYKKWYKNEEKVIFE